MASKQLTLFFIIIIVKEAFPLAVITQITQSKTNPCLITLESGNNTQVLLKINRKAH